MRFVVVTGMSGSGKRTAMKMLEDVGFYCVDNLPVPLIEKFVLLEYLAIPLLSINPETFQLVIRTHAPLCS